MQIKINFNEFKNELHPKTHSCKVVSKIVRGLKYTNKCGCIAYTIYGKYIHINDIYEYQFDVRSKYLFIII